MGFLDLFKEPDVEKLQGNKDVDGLIKALRHNQTFIREKAAKALGSLNKEKAIAPLIEALNDQSTDVQFKAAQSLKQFDASQISQVLPRIDAILSAQLAEQKKSDAEKQKDKESLATSHSVADSGKKESDEANPVNLNPNSTPMAPQEIKAQTSDSLAGWAIWAVTFALLSVTLIGGAVGGIIAGIISFPITKAIPVRSNGRKLTVALSVVLIIAAIVLFVAGTSYLTKR